MAERRPLVLNGGKLDELPLGDTLPGASVPSPTGPGQVLYSADGLTFEWVCPLQDEDGFWIVDEDGILVVDG